MDSGTYKYIDWLCSVSSSQKMDKAVDELYVDLFNEGLHPEDIIEFLKAKVNKTVEPYSSTI